MNDRLRKTYDDIRPLLNTPEPFPVVETVELHRQYWRPPTTKLVLLAESHVRTTEDELQREVRVISGGCFGAPSAYVRLVYCLGYGENHLLESPITPNSGTVQFWKIFYSCLHPITSANDFSLLKKQTEPAARVKTKIDILTGLQAKGVWLLDASIVGLYDRQIQKIDQTTCRAILLASWTGYLRYVLQSADPQGILCIGCGVATALQGELSRFGVPWGVVPQPQARLATAEHDAIFNIYYQVANDPSKAGGFRKCKNFLQ
jgi:hypothetical protein